ncbi:hypothetical protein Kpol_538p31 [Vanderwaltozyma polyspora DSM 70294]|uniref:Cyclin-like domain-containing protein n=1 Tax=Vanderwaltozyma polyspora (strain ATCC 22028 / DSM 70294 / BCRC 21397 / CBS 2163 / NBRC 10782 / NRRL Y-8283 / UCD 57-17) TaxID=436907 RepID=A7TKE4_VANPO|nr:uncharacterized protein Kpol_538p31 [Vanderwaltozyma polyspora DSM 70294]EDO17271.1 hypothetical protein Kpol_538p31 [Vanderwaltozyma polyspora DSM 70294]
MQLIDCHTSFINEYCNDYKPPLKSVVLTNSIETFKQQPYITDDSRKIIIDFTLFVHHKLDLSRSTLFQAFSIIDHYTCNYIIYPSQLQLLALTSLWISSKFWDVKNKCIRMKHLLQLCSKLYDSSEFIDMERQLLKSFNWDIRSLPTMNEIINQLLFELSLPIENHELLQEGSMMIAEWSYLNIDLTYSYSTLEIAKGCVHLMLLITNAENIGDKYPCIDAKILCISLKLLEVVNDENISYSNLQIAYPNFYNFIEVFQNNYYLLQDIILDEINYVTIVGNDNNTSFYQSSKDEPIGDSAYRAKSNEGEDYFSQNAIDQDKQFTLRAQVLKDNRFKITNRNYVPLTPCTPKNLMMKGTFA